MTHHWGPTVRAKGQSSGTTILRALPTGLFSATLMASIALASGSMSILSSGHSTCPSNTALTSLVIVPAPFPCPTVVQTKSLLTLPAVSLRQVIPVRGQRPFNRRLSLPRAARSLSYPAAEIRPTAASMSARKTPGHLPLTSGRQLQTAAPSSLGTGICSVCATRTKRAIKQVQSAVNAHPHSPAH